MSELTTLEPRRLWGYFLELSKIPRGSKNEAAAARWAVEQARELGLEVEADAAGNVVVRKPATAGREGRPGLALQAHLDMVCEKNEGTAHDFQKDGIQVVRDGDTLRARGTTLGADNGVGVAAALAVLAAKDLSHPALEVLFTVDEETGLTGANAVQPGWLRSPRLLNLDSEEEGELTIGCAGGVDTAAIRPVIFTAPGEGRRAMRLKVYGLKGGHSGIDIAAGRGNALRVLAQLLAELLPAHDLQLSSVKGGNKRNAIPREAAAVVHVVPSHLAAASGDVARLAREWSLALGALDPGLAVSLEELPAGDRDEKRVLSPADAAAVIGLLLAAPHGVEAMSPDIAGLVQTSTNMGVADTGERTVEVNFLTRSSIESSRSALVSRIVALARLAGFQAHGSNGYPGWKPEPGSAIVKLVTGAHQELFGKPMAVKAIHAGLECGILRGKYPDVEMASIGPSMWDVHTPDEHVSIPSVQNFWRLLGAVLERA
jgi:dipeptidase D